MISTGKIIKKGMMLRESLIQKYSNPQELQKSELLKLLILAKDTAFGQHYHFDKILREFGKMDQHYFSQAFQATVPIHDYSSMYKNWWNTSREGKKNVTWPGKVKYYALSSGTSDDSSKHIPITKDMLTAIRKTGIRQLLSLSHFDIAPRVFNKGALMLGGSTKLKKVQSYYDADLSGITTSKIPYWFRSFYKPGKKISKCDDWGDKLERITNSAPDWDIGFLVGVPAWMLLLLEKIIDRYQLNNIHDLWPNLSVFVHGGVSFEPYKNSFSRLLGKEITYIETYLASEGFLAYQDRPETQAMKLVLNNGIFFEFVPFNEQNFDSEGNIKPDATAFILDDVQETQEYALLISTCAGAWRYLIGDVIRFTSKDKAEIIITGRTKHFMSLCGEHLSVDNMNKAIQLVEDELNIQIKEFTLSGGTKETTFYHHWYIGSLTSFPENLIRNTLDEKLKMLNDDYRVERKYALKNIQLSILPPNLFYEWMKQIGKEGGQHKFPRVLKGRKKRGWESFLEQQLKIY